MEPTIAECAAFTDINAVATWAGLRVDSDARRTLFEVFGLTGDEHPRVVAFIDPGEWQRLLTTWTVPDGVPSPVQMSQGGLVGLACRIKCGTVERAEEARERAAEKLRLEAAATMRDATGAVTIKKVKLSTVADQSNDLEVVELSQAKVSEAYRRYADLTGGPPAPHEELTLEQLTALHALLAGQGPPYVDFSVWGPFGHRISKRVKLRGMTLSPSGELLPVELYGPSSFAAWDQCYRVFRTGAMMLGALSASSLDAYRDHLALYAQRYGGECWIILYQADVRARLEHIERMRRRATATPSHGFREDQPWEWCLRQVVEDTAFWRRELEEPAMLVLARASRLTQVVDGDAPVSSGSPPARGLSSGAASHQASGTKRPASRPARQHSAGEDGSMIANRRGAKLCELFQKGGCDTTGPRGTCPRDGRQVHQCAKCLSVTHGAHVCHERAARDPTQHRKGGKGKGKGRKGGSAPQS